MSFTHRSSQPGRICAASALAALACVWLAVPVHAAAKQQPRAFKADYAVTIYGLTVARSQFTSRISPDSFKLEGAISSAGLAVIFDNTRASTVATGRFSKDATLPDDYSVSYTFGKKMKRTTLAFADGKVSKVINVPPLQKRGKDWVPLDGKDLVAVTDPISAVLVRAPSLGQVCRRTIKVFDGELRADLRLSPVGTGPVDMGVYKGDAAECSGKFVPVAGYRPGNKSIRYLRDRSDIRITFAPLGETGVYAPIHATVGTQIGTVTFRARQIEAIE
ncbi:hypothetical protein MesoLjLc_15610 [Mesorhizobium sp. L-8-10]|uniref:DUF3108 domain-containing protein n=1 Tax=Mesorhizobium sp. L-8-10 TaxID=2744523 RepID=UPI0019361832|nr:DUF3108 domain-containing protein [Mesorhizobium sp. L-8-10]BCH29631.1 hypothetical protein MesoLjLc_15610 [Mesorhizobium sp. L-8-10]